MTEAAATGLPIDFMLYDSRMAIATADTLPPAQRYAALSLLFPPDGDAASDLLRHDFPARLLDCVFAAYEGSQIVAAVFVEPLAGHCANIWGPTTAANVSHAVASEFAAHVGRYLDELGFRLVQSFVRPHDDERLRTSLGLEPVTSVLTLQIALPAGSATWPSGNLHFVDQSAGVSEAFQHALIDSFEGSLDCPEWNGRRTPAEVIEAHRATAPSLSGWFLAQRLCQTVGLVILAEGGGPQGLDLAYLAVLPHCRGQGIGRELVQFSLRKAAELQAASLSVLVDIRNLPAVSLYRSAGFYEVSSQSVFLRAIS